MRPLPRAVVLLMGSGVRLRPERVLPGQAALLGLRGKRGEGSRPLPRNGEEAASADKMPRDLQRLPGERG